MQSTGKPSRLILSSWPNKLFEVADYNFYVKFMLKLAHLEIVAYTA